jgi:hypothetical protein
MTANSETAILERLIEPERDDLSPEAARYFLSVDFKTEDIRRMNELAELARRGALTGDQREELENYNRVGHLLAMLQSKARRVLHSSSAA